MQEVENRKGCLTSIKVPRLQYWQMSAFLILFNFYLLIKIKKTEGSLDFLDSFPPNMISKKPQKHNFQREEK